jgi:hypothetical protein
MAEQQSYPTQPVVIPAQRVREPLSELDDLLRRVAMLEAKLAALEVGPRQ